MLQGWLWNHWHAVESLLLTCFLSKHQAGMPVCGWISCTSLSPAFPIRPLLYKAVFILWLHHSHPALVLVCKWIILMCIMDDFNFKSDLVMKASWSSVIFSSYFVLSFMRHRIINLVHDSKCRILSGNFLYT